MASLTLRNICKIYGDVEVSRDINLDIRDGEFVVFVGPSGCGKSTLLRMIAGLEDITSGDLFIDNDRMNDVPPMARGVGMVFQSYALYPHMNVAENMAFGLKLAGASRADIQARVKEVAEILQLSHLLDRKPKDLSGGQRQRVAIGRTLVRQPRVFLFDEPLSNLDAGLRVKMRIEIAKLHQKLKATMIYVTHDQVEAMTLADKIVALDHGRIAQVGTPMELYHYPSNKFVAGFIGSPKMNFIDCTVTSASPQHAGLELPGGLQLNVPVHGGSLSTGERVTLGIRPEHLVTPEHADAILNGRITVVERLGYETLVHVEVEGYSRTLTLRSQGTQPWREGEDIALGIPANQCHLFRENGDACTRLYKEPGLDL
ncbi:maltose/maltodextrin ABC transporter ATP-binding protein MalK [Hahella sp. SMD15-11]|uniref:Maltose/maltodextrin ABC transporter ATP-binding protein MalK n=1 Tax=Thermohahella caldifontis TaxID=3142973 RepID=A0AB39USL7_9GAMM